MAKYEHAATDIIKKTMDSEDLYESNYMFLLSTRDTLDMY